MGTEEGSITDILIFKVLGVDWLGLSNQIMQDWDLSELKQII